MLFSGKETKDEVLNILQSDKDAFDNVIAMANVGVTFSQIVVLEDFVSALVFTSKVRLEKHLGSDALSDSELFLKRDLKIKASTLGRLITAIEKSGIEGRDIRYLRAIVELRNDFVHRFLSQVPLPGDWKRYNFTIEQFSGYTRYVLRHLSIAQHFFPRIMVKHGLLAGEH